ncbi:MAG: FAD-dependent oxidoreductase [Desulfobacterales bacterium]|nr:FAD-dependent oxidoreductase [Desulfobacterales bacterium]
MKPEWVVDVAVIGGGGAGLPAAVTAAENGASDVVVLEQRSKLGGNASLAWGLFAAESPLQKQELVNARKEDLFKVFMDWAHWKNNPAITRNYIWKSGDTIRWLEKMGLTFELVRYFPGQEPPVWHVPRGKGAALVDALTRRCKSLGVEILLNTRCRGIMTDQNGMITGITAESDGEQTVIKARSVIIATGGYGGNRELLERYVPDYDERIRCFGLPYAGDGLLMATTIGAATESLGGVLLEWPHVHGDISSIASTVAREPYTIYVNKTGKRFVDEEKGLHAFECANAVLRQPEKCGYILADEAMIIRMEENGAILGRGNDRAGRRRSMPGLRKHLQDVAEKSKSSLLISSSWSEIAAWIDSDPVILQKTIDEYNLCCSLGYDDYFCKERNYLLPLNQPPFYAIRGDVIFLHTLGGLKINEHMEVLDVTGRPIGGLYAVGADTGGWEPDTYCDRFSGTALGFAVNSGRIAAENAIRYCRCKC